RELGEFLRLAEEEALPVYEVRGSYAGAMGVGQFIPSSYRAYAVDMDGSGRRDLWRSLPDALGSVANYMARHGRQADAPTALPVDPAGDSALPEKQSRTCRTLAELVESGLEFDADGLDDDVQAAVVELDGEVGLEDWRGRNTFPVITRYDRSPL